MTLLKLAGKKDGLAGLSLRMEQPGESLGCTCSLPVPEK